VSQPPKRNPSEHAALVAKYRERGLWGGVLFGALIGVSVAGRKLHGPGFSALDFLEWTVGGAFVLGLIGYLFVEIFIIRLMDGPATSISSSSTDDGGDSGGGSADGASSDN